MLLPKPHTLLFIFLQPQKPEYKKRPGKNPRPSTQKTAALEKNFQKGLRFKVTASDYYTKKRTGLAEKNNRLVNGNFC